MTFKTQYQMYNHMLEQFGHRPLIVHALKVNEEAGEVAAAAVREEEQRGGVSWRDELIKEIGDVHVTLVNMLSSMNVDSGITFANAEDAFMKRTWDIQNKPEATQ